VSEQVAKAYSLEVTEAADGSSSQVDEEELITPDDCFQPPANLEQLAHLTSVNGERRSVIEAIARNTVGLGYEPEIIQGLETRIEGEPDEALAQVRNTLEVLAARDQRLDSPTFTELLMAVKTDEEETGQGYIEVSRNRTTGRINGLYHLPAKRMRRLKDRSGYKLLSASEAQYPTTGTLGEPRDVRFYNFGEKVAYAPDGRPLPRLAKGGLRWATQEVICFRIYTSESREYGLPRDVGLSHDYLADMLAGETNVSFFGSSGTPPTLVFVSGKEEADGTGGVRIKVPVETAKRVVSTIKSDSGSVHRVAIIGVPPGTDIKDVKLGSVSERDVGYVGFRKDVRSRRLATFRLAPIFIADVSGEGRYSEEVQRSLTLEQMFDPEQRRYADRLHRLLSDLGFAEFALRFIRLAVESDAQKRDSADKMAEVGVLTRREHREAHGRAPLPEAEKSSTEIEWNGKTYKSADPEPGEVPFGWNDEIVNAGTPPGAENRTVDGVDQRGQKPGIGGREQKSTDAELQAQADAVAKGEGVEHVEHHVVDLTGDLRVLSDEQIQDAMRRAHTVAGLVVDEIEARKLVAQNGDGSA
jgi:hypothetical protein